MSNKQITTQEMAGVVLMALTMWREARGASSDARMMIAHVIAERVRQKTWYGTTDYDVCVLPWQFSSITAHGDPQLYLWPKSDDRVWKECLEVADRFSMGTQPICQHFPVPDLYFSDGIPTPKWAKVSTFVCRIDNLNFYRSHV